MSLICIDWAIKSHPFCIRPNIMHYKIHSIRFKEGEKRERPITTFLSMCLCNVGLNCTDTVIIIIIIIVNSTTLHGDCTGNF